MYKEIDLNKRRTFLLIFVFLILIMGLGWVIGKALDIVWIFPAAIMVSIFQAWFSYYYSDKVALAISGAKEASREQYTQLHQLVENLAITSGVPKPKVYIINDTAPNAFATGRDPNHASIAVTRGLLEKLNRTELEGVIAHEMSHVRNYDIRLMTIVVVLVGIIALVSDWFLRWTWWGGGRRRDNEGGGQVQAILFLVAIVLAILSPIIATIIQLAISRKREFLADASGALLTRYPEGLASALEKISSDKEPLEVANKATSHLYISDPIKAHGGKGVGWLASLFNTHPPAEERIERLRAMIPGS